MQMDNLIDVTHTVKASAVPSQGARLMYDPTTEERFWVEIPRIPEPDAAALGLPVPDPEITPVPMPTPKKGKKKHGA